MIMHICYPGTEIEADTDANNPNYRPVSRHTTTTVITPISEHVDRNLFSQDPHFGTTSTPKLDIATANTVTLSVHHQLHKSNSDLYENI